MMIMSDETPLSDVRFLTVAETATIMRVSLMTVYRLVHSGELEAIRVGRSFRIPEAAVLQYAQAEAIAVGMAPTFGTSGHSFAREVRHSKIRRESGVPPTRPLLAGVPVRIYLEDGIDPERVESAVIDLLEAYGFTVEDRNPPVMGSWFGELRVKAKRSNPSVDDQLAKLARAIELQGLDRPQSEVDLNQAEAVRRLLSALATEENALIQSGSIFIIKIDGNIIVRNLTQLELSYYNRNPALFKNPRKALDALQRGLADHYASSADG
jgi:excisionase family DNA binding protein